MCQHGFKFFNLPLNQLKFWQLEGKIQMHLDLCQGTQSSLLFTLDELPILLSKANSSTCALGSSPSRSFWQ